MATKNSNDVLITTVHRGVFFGTLKATRDDGKTVVLDRPRCAIYWATKNGFLELASVGPNTNSKIGAEAPGKVTFYDVTSIAECSEKAVSAWRNHS